LPALSLAGGILGLFGAGSALFNMPQAGEKEVWGVAGASLLLLLFSAYDVYAAAKSSVTIDDEGVSLGKKKFAYKDIYGLSPPTARGSRTGNNGRPTVGALGALTPQKALMGSSGLSDSAACWPKRSSAKKCGIKTRFQYGYSILRQTAVMALASRFYGLSNRGWRRMPDCRAWFWLT
jgi:hypothetical protein